MNIKSLVNICAVPCLRFYKSLRHRAASGRKAAYCVDFPSSEVTARFPNRNQAYAYFHHYFWNLAPEWLREHRAYFQQNKRGFGEDAFHALWYFIFRDFRPASALEIGIYRGQVVTLWKLLAREMKLTTQVVGISPFLPAGDSVSEYLKSIDYHADVLKNFARFGLEPAELKRGYSTDPEMIAFIRSRKWDLVYIDGNHDYEIARQDFQVCSESLAPGGIIVLDDSALETDYNPPPYASKGHPGPSRLAREIDLARFEEILSVGHNRVFRLR